MVGLTPHAVGTLWLIPALPLAGAAITLFFGNRLGKWAGVLATVAVGLSFAVALAAVLNLLTFASEDRLGLQHMFDWISVGGFNVGADLRLDTLSATMILVITGIGALIHLYSIGYMEHDPRRGRFFAYMNLFVFFMLMLVLGANYLVLYLGWEGVGLCSYLLIGFWFDVPANAEAAKKAFITTRIGDTLMLIGLALLVFKFGTLDFEAIFGTAGSVLTKDAATVIALLLFAGAIGKSAQLPLQVWLPDAMAGPTPVSALIHAATMVTAGVYLVVRSHVLFELSGVALTVVAGGRGRDGVVRRDVRDRPVRHQTGAGVLDDQPARLHVHRRRDARLRRRDVLPRRPRVLQGPDVPGRRLGDPRDARRAGHAADGGPAAGDAVDVRDVRDRRPRPGGGAAARRVLREGRPARGGEPYRPRGGVRARDDRRVPHGVLHRADGQPDVPRGGRAPTRRSTRTSPRR